MVNIIAIALLCLLLPGVFFIVLHPAMSKFRIFVYSRPLAMISFSLIIVYVAVGLLEQITIDAEVGSQTVIDRIFVFAPKERTYSAPFAGHLLLAFDEQASDDNRLRGFHLLGTDINGYDVLHLVVKGSGTTLLLLGGSILISFPLGLLAGLLAGYTGGWIDDLVQWAYNTFASIPWLLFVIAFLVLFGRDLIWICLAFGLTGWVDLARLIRGEVLKLRELDFSKAAIALGLPHHRVLLRHFLPNLSHVFLITMTLQATSIILAESILTFIGVGVQPGNASWGTMLVDAQSELVRSPPIWWPFVGASFLGIFPLVLALNIAGDTLRDWYDPRSEGH